MSHQPHVMKHGQPAGAARRGVMPERVAHVFEIGDGVSVRHDDTARIQGRAGGVLQVGGLVRVRHRERPRMFAATRARPQVVDGQGPDAARNQRLPKKLDVSNQLQLWPPSNQNGRPRLPKATKQQPPCRFVALMARRPQRCRNQARHDAPEKRLNKFQALGGQE